MGNDLREYIIDDEEEKLRTLVDAVLSRMHTSYPAIVSEDTDGHTVKLKMGVKGRKISDQGKVESIEYPELQTVPVHFPGGGGKDENSVLITHPLKKAEKKNQGGGSGGSGSGGSGGAGGSGAAGAGGAGGAGAGGGSGGGQGEEDWKTADEGIVVFGRGAMDNWHDKSGPQDPNDARTHNLSDALFIPGIRSKPRKYKWYEKNNMQMRSIDKKHVVNHDPKKGTIIRSVEEAQKSKGGGSSGSGSSSGSSGSGSGASGGQQQQEEEDPYEKPKKAYDAYWHAKEGIQNRALNDKKHHRTNITHDAGHEVRIDVEEGKENGKHYHKLNPEKGYEVHVDIQKGKKEGKHYHKINTDKGHTISADDEKHKIELTPGNSIKITSSTKISAKAPSTDIDSDTKVKNNNLTVDKDVNAQNVNAKQKVNAGESMSAPMGMFGGMGGMGGGAMNSGGGANSGIGAGAMQDGAAATNVGALGGDLSGTLPNPQVVGTHITQYAFTALPVGAIGMMAVVTDGAASLAWGATVAGGGTAIYLVWFNGTNWTVLGQ